MAARRLFIGTNTWRTSKGLYTCLFDPATGRLSEPEFAGDCPSPANLITHPSGKFLYACVGMSASSGGQYHKTAEGQSPVVAFAVEGARLRPLNTVSAGGILPTHGVVDRTGRNLLLSCYKSGLSVVFRLNDDGSIGARTAEAWSPGLAEPQRSKAEPHIAVLSKNQRFLIVPELHTDQCVVHRFDAAQGTLAFHGLAKTPAHAGPRHFDFHPTYRFGYCSNEHGGSVTAFSWDEEKGELKTLQTVPSLPADFTAKNRVSDIRVHPSGRFVYAANRGHETLAIFAVDPESGMLTPAGHAATGGRRIWAITIDPEGAWMILPHVDTDNVVVLKIDPETGMPTPTGEAITVSAASHAAMI